MSHTSCGGEDNRCEDTTFYVLDSLTILPFLQQFVLPVGRRDIHGTITGCVWVENPNIENASCDLFQKPLVLMSRRAPSSEFAESRASISLFRGCKSGSVATL